jgi:hypothetical protein
MAERRRLPVLQSPPSAREGDDDARPPWHWVGFGAVAIFAGWLPLAYVGGAVSARMMAARFGADASRDAIEVGLAAMSAGERAELMATVALPNLLALAVAAFIGGAIVGRFGGASAPARVAGGAGAATALIASVSAWSGLTTASLVATAVTFAVAIGFAAWGGRFGGGRAPKR